MLHSISRAVGGGQGAFEDGGSESVRGAVRTGVEPVIVSGLARALGCTRRRVDGVLLEGSERHIYTIDK